jgi:hypothetical protein
MKHFLSPELAAPNVLKIPVDYGIVREFLPLASDEGREGDYATLRPPWESDIRWISASAPKAFERFEGAFRDLGVAAHVAPYLDLDQEVRLYAGFLVTRRSCSKPNFHRDWEATNNEAFTLITPVSDNAAGFGLLYRKLNGEIGEYEYVPGEAIVFGDHFIHSTKPGESDEPVVLMSFTFGTDKMVHWDKIFRTAGYQSRLVRRPDGEFVRLDGSAGKSLPDQ